MSKKMAYRSEPKRKPYPETTPEARALNILGDKWTLLVLKLVIEQGATRFVEVRRGLDDSISTEQLRTVLNRLVDAGLLTRTRYNEAPPRVDYEATDKGKGIKPILKALAAWDSKWAS